MYSSRLLEAMRNLGRAQELAESRRLFYVAATRAKERLILAGKQPKQVKNGLQKLQDCWQKWFEEALGLTEGDKKKGAWEDAADGFRIQIITGVRGIEPPKTPSPPLPSEALHLAYIHERPRFPTIATTRLEKMRQDWRENHGAWWLRYQVNLLPQVGDPPPNFMDHGFQEEGETIGMAVGTLVHRVFEMGGGILNQPATEREKLLRAMAANLLSTPLDQDGSLGMESLTPPGHQIVHAIVNAVQGILERIKQLAAGDPLRGMLEADGESEVDFVLGLGRWRVSGRFDKLLPVGEGRFEIVDWKTDGDTPTIVERYQPQMKLYALALYRCDRAARVEGKIRAHLALLHHMQVETLRFSAAELEAFASQIEAELKEMDRYAPAGLTN
jgi:ATP-dependent exoDNAse (exonuclease V) beta subunit